MSDHGNGKAPGRVCCPKCGSLALIAHGKRNALYPMGCWLVIGFAFAMLHKVASPHEYECRDCAARFARRDFSARIALGLLILSVLTYIVIGFVNPGRH